EYRQSDKHTVYSRRSRNCAAQIQARTVRHVAGPYQDEIGALASRADRPAQDGDESQRRREHEDGPQRFLACFPHNSPFFEVSLTRSTGRSRSRSVTGEADLLRAAWGVVSDAHRGRPGPDGLRLERHVDVATAVHGQGTAALVAQNKVLIVGAGERDALNGQRRGAAVGERDRLVRARCADFLAPEQQGCPGDGEGG